MLTARGRRWAARSTSLGGQPKFSRSRPRQPAPAIPEAASEVARRTGQPGAGDGRRVVPGQ
eukprot:298409-Lingulodinium_polyedra.AAC.1